MFGELHQGSFGGFNVAAFSPTAPPDRNSNSSFPFSTTETSSVNATSEGANAGCSNFSGNWFHGQTGVTGTRKKKFRPVMGSETMTQHGRQKVLRTRTQSITCMGAYQNKSFEELHFEDYQGNPERSRTRNPGVSVGGTQPCISHVLHGSPADSAFGSSSYKQSTGFSTGFVQPDRNQAAAPNSPFGALKPGTGFFQWSGFPPKPPHNDPPSFFDFLSKPEPPKVESLFQPPPHWVPINNNQNLFNSKKSFFDYFSTPSTNNETPAKVIFPQWSTTYHWGTVPSFFDFLFKPTMNNSGFPSTISQQNKLADWNGAASGEINSRFGAACGAQSFNTPSQPGIQNSSISFGAAQTATATQSFGGASKPHTFTSSPSTMQSSGSLFGTPHQMQSLFGSGPTPVGTQCFGSASDTDMNISSSTMQNAGSLFGTPPQSQSTFGSGPPPIGTQCFGSISNADTNTSSTTPRIGSSFPTSSQSQSRFGVPWLLAGKPCSGGSLNATPAASSSSTTKNSGNSLGTVNPPTMTSNDNFASNANSSFFNFLSKSTTQEDQTPIKPTPTSPHDTPCSGDLSNPGSQNTSSLFGSAVPSGFKLTSDTNPSPFGAAHEPMIKDKVTFGSIASSKMAFGGTSNVAVLGAPSAAGNGTTFGSTPPTKNILGVASGSSLFGAPSGPSPVNHGAPLGGKPLSTSTVTSGWKYNTTTTQTNKFCPPGTQFSGFSMNTSPATPAIGHGTVFNTNTSVASASSQPTTQNSGDMFQSKVSSASNFINNTSDNKKTAFGNSAENTTPSIFGVVSNTTTQNSSSTLGTAAIASTNKSIFCASTTATFGSTSNNNSLNSPSKKTTQNNGMLFGSKSSSKPGFCSTNFGFGTAFATIPTSNVTTSTFGGLTKSNPESSEFTFGIAASANSNKGIFGAPAPQVQSTQDTKFSFFSAPTRNTFFSSIPSCQPSGLFSSAPSSTLDLGSSSTSTTQSNASPSIFSVPTTNVSSGGSNTSIFGRSFKPNIQNSSSSSKGSFGGTPHRNPTGGNGTDNNSSLLSESEKSGSQTSSGVEVKLESNSTEQSLSNEKSDKSKTIQPSNSNDCTGNSKGVNPPC